MRFFENGPSIPDELLTARDEGRVVFFCGAGVSRARAGLTDFFGLADKVIRKLGVSSDSPARKILNEAGEIAERTGVRGLISADRIFGLLERDFLVRDIESEVAKALKPKPDVDLSAHRILLDLATTPEGKVRLVTTNFDRLFDDCDRDLQIWKQPRLPDPSRQNEMDGIIYLHGCTTKDYDGSEGADGFILSSSKFGQAYLSDGWATAFFREIIDRYIVVFVGYSADDPPVQYLLEALNKREGQLNGAYAFQSGVSSEAAAIWRHKGVKAIAYSEEEKHRALWETLEAWAERARATEEWYQSVIALARKGPANLEPHERGQVAHIISTLEGVRKFAASDPPPPADWLCVFDPSRRYAKPMRTDKFGTEGPLVDPFNIYGLDSDIAPNNIDPGNHNAKREAPSSAWDGFAASRLDRQNLQDGGFPAIRGHWSTNVPTLPSRLNQIGVWFSKVADQPAVVWWAAGQTGLHPTIQQRIKQRLVHPQMDVPPVIRKAWRYLFESWAENSDNLRYQNFHRDWYDLKAMIEKDGWDSAAVREYAAINRPYLKVRFRRGPIPPSVNDDLRLNDLLRLDVAYPDPPKNANIPDEWLAFAISELRKNLEHALHLETERGGYGLWLQTPIVPDDDPSIDPHGRTHGLSGRVISFSSMFSRLIELDVSLARQEFAAWPANDDTIFSRLRIWACGKEALVSSNAFGQIIAGLSDDAFWDDYHQRDLLLVLAQRWDELQDEARKEIEKRILKGREKWEGEKDDEYEERRAWAILNRLTWLARNGCDFSVDLEAESKKLCQIATSWKPEDAEKAARSWEIRGGRVSKDPDYSSLLHVSPDSILSKALEMSGRTEDFLVERDPFAGLSEEEPALAFAALRSDAERNEYPEWAWRTFLDSASRRDDNPEFISEIAEFIFRCPDNAVKRLVRPVSDWILSTSEQLASRFPTTFEKVLSKFIAVLRSQPPPSDTIAIRDNKEANWAFEAINAPIGKIALTLFKDPRTESLEVGGGLPAEWLAYVEDLLSFDGDLYRHAIVIFFRNLNWFYSIDPSWTESNLLSILDSGDDDQNAAWSGFFWGATVPTPKLYMRIKPSLLSLAKERNLSSRRHVEGLARIILVGWGNSNEETGERFVSNGEMREVLLHTDDEFRIRILWLTGKWAGTNEDSTAEKWSAMLLELLQDVWPRQKSVKTPAISGQLCNLAFSNPELFPEIVDIILPLLTPSDREHLMLPRIHESEDGIVDRYPHQTLALLYVVLPDNVTDWPFGIEETLQRISEADGGLNSDERLLELKRKWNAR